MLKSEEKEEYNHREPEAPTPLTYFIRCLAKGSVELILSKQQFQYQSVRF